MMSRVNMTACTTLTVLKVGAGKIPGVGEKGGAGGGGRGSGRGHQEQMSNTFFFKQALGMWPRR